LLQWCSAALWVALLLVLGGGLRSLLCRLLLPVPLGEFDGHASGIHQHPEYVRERFQIRRQRLVDVVAELRALESRVEVRDLIEPPIEDRLHYWARLRRSLLVVLAGAHVVLPRVIG